jgi:hypothetical protein
VLDGDWISILYKGRDSSLLHRAQTGSEGLPSFLCNRFLGLFSGYITGSGSYPIASFGIRNFEIFSLLLRSE